MSTVPTDINEQIAAAPEISPEIRRLARLAPRPTTVAQTGLSAALFHPTTGYSLPDAVRLADHLVALDRWDADSLFTAIRDHSLRQWRQRGFFRLLNRMLFMAGPADRRWTVMQRFYRLREPLIQRFYAAHPTLWDRLRIVSGKPPVPVGEALRALAAGNLHHKDKR